MIRNLLRQARIWLLTPASSIMHCLSFWCPWLAEILSTWQTPFVHIHRFKESGMSAMLLKTDGDHPQVRLIADLIPTLVDKRAALTPHNVYAEYLVSPQTYDQGYRRILFTNLANAVNGNAWWLHRTLGPSHSFETLAYIGPNDIRYPAIILGAVKNWLRCMSSKLSFDSPALNRNSRTARYS